MKFEKGWQHDVVRTLLLLSRLLSAATCEPSGIEVTNAMVADAKVN